jgi:SAM-dependent methyltransferase
LQKIQRKPPVPAVTTDARQKLVAQVLQRGFTHKLFPAHLQLIPQMHELYEMELASAEAALMSDAELVRNAGYFARVGDDWTRHFLICSGESLRLPKHSSSQLRSFFQTNQFRTGYATHGLFPYRGKFHPQMIKGLLNAMGLRPGETVLDPMMGSGTALIEARLMGIKSVGLDASPFCHFMVRAKLDALTVPLKPLQSACLESKSVFEHFRKRAGQARAGSKVRYCIPAEPGDGAFRDGPSPFTYDPSFGGLPGGCEVATVYGFLLLAYLDSAGYSERSERKAPYDQFHSILERYYFVAEKIQNVLSGLESEMAEASALQGDARKLPLEDGSVEGILFSPPYSFAIDYLENDSFHLGYLGADLEALRQQMVGLRGRSLKEKFELYGQDMAQVMAECARVLRPGRFCTVVVGTNNNQLSKILGTSPEKVTGIDHLISDWAGAYGLQQVRKLSRQIRGMSNTMRTEYIVFLQKS